MPGGEPPYSPGFLQLLLLQNHPNNFQLVSPPKLSGVTTISIKVSPGAHSTVPATQEPSSKLAQGFQL